MKNFIFTVCMIAILGGCTIFDDYLASESADDDLWTTNQQEFIMSDADNNSQAPIVARTLDGQEVELSVTLIFQINADDLDSLKARWSNFDENYRIGLIRPVTRSITRDVVSRYDAAAIALNIETQQDLANEIEAILIEELQGEGFLVHDLLITDLTFSAEFSDFIETQISATQSATDNNE